MESHDVRINCLLAIFPTYINNYVDYNNAQSVTKVITP